MLRDHILAWQDTVTGFLLAGVGNVDLRRKSNFLVVTESEYLAAMLIQMTYLLLSLTESRADAETSVKTIEDAFKEFTTREDIAIIMINQYVRFLLPITGSTTSSRALHTPNVCRVLFDSAADCQHDQAFAQELSEGKHFMTLAHMELAVVRCCTG